MDVLPSDPPKIKLAFACPKQWEQMEPCSRGKFCQACSETVLDLSNKTVQEIEELQQVKGSICGRFYAHQVEIQRKPFPKFTWRKFIASLFIALGLSSLSK